MENIAGEGHIAAAGWGIGGSVERQTAGPKCVHSGNGRPLIVPHCSLPVTVSMPLRIVNHSII